MNLRTAILQASAESLDMTTDEMLAPSRTRLRAYARFIAMTLGKELMPFVSLREIAELVGRSDHGTALYGLNQAKLLELADPAFASALQTARESVKRNRES
jgi:chromosomal replication initiation ATPase DnaA